MDGSCLGEVITMAGAGSRSTGKGTASETAFRHRIQLPPTDTAHGNGRIPRCCAHVGLDPEADLGSRGGLKGWPPAPGRAAVPPRGRQGAPPPRDRRGKRSGSGAGGGGVPALWPAGALRGRGPSGPVSGRPGDRAGAASPPRLLPVPPPRLSARGRADAGAPGLPSPGAPPRRLRPRLSRSWRRGAGTGGDAVSRAASGSRDGAGRGKRGKPGKNGANRGRLLPSPARSLAPVRERGHRPLPVGCRLKLRSVPRLQAAAGLSVRALPLPTGSAVLPPSPPGAGPPPALGWGLLPGPTGDPGQAPRWLLPAGTAGRRATGAAVAALPALPALPALGSCCTSPWGRHAGAAAGTGWFLLPRSFPERLLAGQTPPAWRWLCQSRGELEPVSVGAAAGGTGFCWVQPFSPAQRHPPRQSPRAGAGSIRSGHGRASGQIWALHEALLLRKTFFFSSKRAVVGAEAAPGICTSSCSPISDTVMPTWPGTGSNGHPGPSGGVGGTGEAAWLCRSVGRAQPSAWVRSMAAGPRVPGRCAQ
ncbi:uncharacterized protein M6G45_004809 [Spheniscus humboldti]